MIESPKTRFMARKELAAKHRDVVVSDSFVSATDASLLQMIISLDATHDPVIAASRFQMVMGAVQYRNTLLNIAELQTPPPSKPRTGLDPNA